MIIINRKNSIIILLITMILILSFTNKSIAEHRISIPANLDYYYDSDNVIKKNGFLQAWIIIDYSKLKREKKARADYTKELFEIDCIDKRLKHIKSIFLDNEKIVLRKDTPNPEWIKHGQESPSYIIIEFICNREWKAEDK